MWATALTDYKTANRALPTPAPLNEPISSHSASLCVAMRHSTRCPKLSHPIYALDMQIYCTLDLGHNLQA